MMPPNTNAYLCPVNATQQSRPSHRLSSNVFRSIKPAARAITSIQQLKSARVSSIYAELTSTTRISNRNVSSFPRNVTWMSTMMRLKLDVCLDLQYVPLSSITTQRSMRAEKVHNCANQMKYSTKTNSNA